MSLSYSSTYDLNLVDCWRGIRRAVIQGLYDPTTFNEAEYSYYDQPCYGDMHEVVKGKFFSFKGPTETRRSLGPGVVSKIPSDYVDVFHSKSIAAIIRLNNVECKYTHTQTHTHTIYDNYIHECVCVYVCVCL